MPSIDDIKAKPLKDQFDVVVDSIFGFGFTGAPRPPFDVIIEVHLVPRTMRKLFRYFPLGTQSLSVTLT